MGSRSTPSTMAAHEGGERCRGAVLLVERREAAADIEPVEHHAGPGDQLADLGQRGRVRLRRRRLRADVEGDAELLGGLPGLDQQARGLGAGNAVLALERDLAVARRHGDAHPQDQVAAAAGLLGDLLQLLLAVEGEAAHAELGERTPDGSSRLDRVHEVELGAGNGRRVLDLGDRGDVELADARTVQRAQQEHRAVRFVGVSDVTGKVLEKPPGGLACSVRAQTNNGPIRLPCANQSARSGKPFHLMGPPPVGLDQGAARTSRSRRVTCSYGK